MKFKIITTLVLFIFLMGSDMLFHSMLMGEMYAQTAHLWRSEVEMHDLYAWSIAGHLLIALVVTELLNRVSGENKGRICVAVLIALSYCGGQLMMYSVVPYGLTMIVCWMVAAMVQYILVALIFNLLKGKLDA